jgi:hypothetical protein
MQLPRTVNMPKLWLDYMVGALDKVQYLETLSPHLAQILVTKILE